MRARICISVWLPPIFAISVRLNLEIQLFRLNDNANSSSKIAVLYVFW